MDQRERDFAPSLSPPSCRLEGQEGQEGKRKREKGQKRESLPVPFSITGKAREKRGRKEDSGHSSFQIILSCCQGGGKKKRGRKEGNELRGKKERSA